VLGGVCCEGRAYRDSGARPGRSATSGGGDGDGGVRSDLPCLTLNYELSHQSGAVKADKNTVTV